MKSLIFKLLAASMVAMGVASAQTTPGKVVQGTIFPGITGQVPNYVIAPQPRFSSDLSTANTATSSATLTRDLTVLMDGAATWKCDTSAQFGYCEFKMNIINSPDQSGNCMAKVSVIGDASLYKIQVWDPNAGALVNELPNPMGNYTVATEVPVTALCGQSRSIRVYQSEAGTSPAINFGRMSYGKNDQVINFMQGGQWVGSLTYPTSANCVWLTTSATFTDFPVDTDCGTPTVAGSVTAPATKVPAAVINTLPGRFLFIASGSFTNGNAGAEVSYRFSDGSKTSTVSSLFTPSANNATTTIVGGITYTAPEGPKTINLQAIATGTATATISSNSAPRIFTIDVYYFPDASLQAIRADQTDYLSDAYVPTLTGFGSVSNATCTEEKSGPKAIYRCSWTCGTATGVEARISIPRVTSSKNPTLLSVGPLTRSGAAADSYYVMVEPGKNYLNFSVQNASGGGNGKANGNSLCVSGNTMSFTANVLIEGWQPNQGAPQLVNTATTPYSGVAKFAVASVSGTSGAVANLLGTLFSGSCSVGSGIFNCPIPAGLFGAAPYCTVSVNGSDFSAYNVKFDLSGTTTTNARFRTQIAGTNTPDNAVSFVASCFGPR